jgi:hypothetical protein
MARSVRINDGAGNSPLIPEISGKFKVNKVDGNGNHVAIDVKQLFAKTSQSATTADLVWEVPTTGGGTTTQHTTNDTPSLCGICNNQAVHYPTVTALNTRWNCDKWKSACKIESIINSTPDVTTANYQVYSRKAGAEQFCPPPPGYILGEFTTYGVKDSLVVYLRRAMTLFANQFYALPTREADPFNPTTGGPCFEACGGDPCYTGGVVLSQICNSPINVNTVLTNYPNNILFASTCISTTGPDAHCTSSCYGTPDAASQYHCRDVQAIIPNILATQTVGDVTGQYAFSELPSFSDPDETDVTIKFNDIGILLQSGCDSAGAASAWRFRLFLPFYVSIPQYANKYIKVTKTGAITGTQTDQVLNQLQKIYNGTIKASNFAITPYDSDGDSVSETLYWGAIGFPKSGTHTHVMVLEIENENENNCAVCINNGGTGGNAQYVRFYPISDSSSGTPFVSPFKEYVTQNINVNGTLYGIPNITQLDVLDTSWQNSVDIRTFYTETTATTVPNPPPTPLTFFNKVDAAYHQNRINSGTYGIFDCNCTIV